MNFGGGGTQTTEEGVSAPDAVASKGGEAASARRSCKLDSASGTGRCFRWQHCWGDAQRNRKLTGSRQEAGQKRQVPPSSSSLRGSSAPYWQGLTETRWQSRNTYVVCRVPALATKLSVIHRVELQLRVILQMGKLRHRDMKKFSQVVGGRARI